jgi:hypothetical protein
MVIYFAEIAGVRAAVDPRHTVEVGIRIPSRKRPNVYKAEWIGLRTWREVAEELGDRALVTRAYDGSIVTLKCVRDASLSSESDEALLLSSEEKRLVLDVLRETGRPDLAEIADPILERVTRTDPPPVPTTAPAKGRP